MITPENWEALKKRLAHLQTKVLDLTYRNPLVKLPLSSRANVVRIVDEPPDSLASSLADGRKFTLIPLPPVETEPKDERTEEFQKALRAMKAEDEEYLASLDAEGSDEEGGGQAPGTAAERKVRNKTRARLGMSPKPEKQDVDIAEHARKNGVNPDFELPEPPPEGTGAPDKHVDKNIQTLLLQQDLDRKLINLAHKSRTFAEETGVGVLHFAFGYLQWEDGSDKRQKIVSPLLLMPVKLTRRGRANKHGFVVEADDDDLFVNFVLSEKLQSMFGVRLPELADGSGVEEYLAAARDMAPKNTPWKVLRQACLGLFPSANMAMFHDLEPTRSWYAQNPVVSDLLLGRQADRPGDLAGAVDPGDPRVEALVHPLVLPADSSQAATIYEVLSGRSMALEGPPGSGKSQTIVNVIAAALGGGLKVLFVAEKAAALEVVKSRLEALGLGEFLLPLLATRSERGQFVDSVRGRMMMTPPEPPGDLSKLEDEFVRCKKTLGDYFQFINSPAEQTDMSARDVIGRYLATEGVRAGLPAELQNLPFPDPGSYDERGILGLREDAGALESLSLESRALGSGWRGATVRRPDSILAKSVLSLAREASARRARALALRDSLAGKGLGLPDEKSVADAGILLESLGAIGEFDAALAGRLRAPGALSAAERFFARARDYRDLRGVLGRLLADPDDPGAAGKIAGARKIAGELGLPGLDPGPAREALAALDDKIALAGRFVRGLEAARAAHPFLAGLRVGPLARAGSMAAAAGPGILALSGVVPADPAALDELRKECLTGLGLQKKAASLAKVFPGLAALEDGLVPAEVLAHAGALASGGFFSFLSKTWRRAKAEFARLAPGAPFDRLGAAASLRSLAAFLTARKQFLAEMGARDLFKSGARGLDTDFSLHLALADFRALVDERLPGPAGRELRERLLSPDKDFWDSLPAADFPDAEFDDLTPDELGRAMPALKAKRDRLAASAAELESLLGLDSPGAAAARTPLVAAGASPELAAGHDAARFGIVGTNLASGTTGAPARAAVWPEFAAAETMLAMLAARDKLRADASGDENAREILGGRDKGLESDPSDCAREIEAAKILASAGDNARGLLNVCGDGSLEKSAAACREFASTMDETRGIGQRIKEQCGLDLEKSLAGLDLDAGGKFLEALGGDERGFYVEANLAGARAKLEAAGLGAHLAAHEKAVPDRRGLAAALEACLYRALAESVRQKTPEAVRDSVAGGGLTKAQRRFAEIDGILSLGARGSLKDKLFRSANPPEGVGAGLKKDYTERSLLWNEINKKRMFLPVRRIILRAFAALREYKPCWMMSPTAVSQYLADESFTFDLGILDEASQMPPENAVSALARCRRILVTGDSNQLPPTSFFKNAVQTRTDPEEDESGAEVVEESVLDLAQQAYQPRRCLAWHYRSRNSALINYSNHAMYQDRLIIYPSPMELRPDMGVELVRRDHLYSKGLNRGEAREMVRAAVRHMTSDPDRSLGLVALNQKQSDYLNELFRVEIENDPAAERYVDNWSKKNDGLERFFVKNLENVQGDERDVIFIGTVYGPEKRGGPTAQRFGPILGQAGQRRLNVLFTRAKQKIVTFTSLEASDIRITRDDQLGLQMLRGWLEYSEKRGRFQELQTSPEPPALSFEGHVRDRIAAGLRRKSDFQVGTAGHKLDLALKSDELPYGYFLGLESDGPLYCGHVAPRDRDRLRGEIMASLGWNLGKLWTYDWFLDPEGEFRRLGDVVSASHAKTLKTMADFPVAPPVLDDDDGDGDDGDDDGRKSGDARKNGGDAEDDDNDGENNADGKKTKTAAKK